MDYYENNDNVIWVYYIGESGVVSTYPFDPILMYEGATSSNLMVEGYIQTRFQKTIQKASLYGLASTQITGVKVK